MLALTITLVASGWFPRSAAAFLSTGDGTWVWQNPLPQGNILNGISCPSNGTCFAVGWSGTVLTTTNGGSTWTVQSSADTSNVLTGVSCPSTGICFAVGAGTILATTDGGTTWTAQSPGTTEPITGVSCPSTGSCLAVGYSGTVLATTNGGSTWTAQRSGTANNLAGVSCPSTSTCFAVGYSGTILATTDGGSTWTAQSSGTTNQLHGVSCPSTIICTAVGLFGTILATTNGGSTWTAQSSSAASLLYEGVSCPSTSTCAAVGDAGTVLTTTNGGSTWIAQSAGTTNGLLGVSCASTTTCLAVGNPGIIVATTNGGSTWVAKSMGSTYQLNGVSCASTSACFAVGFSGTILATTDGGSSTWTAQSSGTGIPLTGVSCPSASTCFAVGSGGSILGTTNGGTTWTAQSSVTGSVGVSCSSTSICFAVGYYGSILATTDAGSTWTAQSSGTANQLAGVSCPSIGTCVAVGNSGTILATTDGGSTWTAQSSGTANNLTGVSCPSTGACFAVGGGSILATTDGGSTWTAQSSVTGNNLLGVSCPSTRICAAVGGGGAILATTDGGSTWTAQNSGTAYYLLGVSCPSTANCFAVGVGGTILFGSLRSGALPVITGITPVSGPAAGGTSVTISGSGFTGATAVSFGTIPAASFNVNSDMQITATSPAGTGVVDVQITTSAGSSATSPADQYTYSAQQVPGRPQNLKVRPGNGYAELFWTPPSNPGSSPVTSYILTAIPAANTDHYAQASIISSTEAASGTGLQLGYITGLLEDCHQEYTFLVRAGNAAGVGPPSFLGLLADATQPSPPDATDQLFRTSGIVAQGNNVPPVVVVTIDGFGSQYDLYNDGNPFTTTNDPLVGGNTLRSVGSGPPVSYCREGEQEFLASNSSPAPSIWNPDMHFDTPGACYSLGADCPQTNAGLQPGFFAVDGSYQASHHYLLDQLVAGGGIALPYSYTSAAKLSLSSNGVPKFTFTGYTKSLSNSQEIPVDVDLLAKEIDSIHHVWPSTKIVILAHSGGGLVAEQYWRTKNYAARNVVRVISFEGPINGTARSTACYPNPSLVNNPGCTLAVSLSGKGPMLLWFMGKQWTHQSKYDAVILRRDTNRTFVAISTEGDNAYDFRTNDGFDSLIPDSIFPCDVTSSTDQISSCQPAQPPSFIDGGVWKSSDPCAWTPELQQAIGSGSDASHPYAIVCRQNVDYVGALKP